MNKHENDLKLVVVYRDTYKRLLELSDSNGMRIRDYLAVLINCHKPLGRINDYISLFGNTWER